MFSTGVVLYELLSGRKPFEGDSPTTVIVKILKDEPPPIDELVPGLAAGAGRGGDAGAAKDRDRRFQTAEELGRELQLIRKTHQLSRLPPMDETRFASTKVLKALHDDLQKQDGTAGASRCNRPPLAAGGRAGRRWHRRRG